MKSKLVVPALPSLAVTLEMARLVQTFTAVPLLRGLGAPVAKLALFASVSVHPFTPRRIEVVLLGAGAVAPSKQFAAAPYPTKSTTDAPIGQPVVVSTVVLFTSATLPAVPDMFVVPVAFTAGNATPATTPPAFPICTK